MPDASAPDAPNEETCFAATTSALLGGRDAVRDERSRAVGRLTSALGECTATLVTPDVAITAAHCVAFKTCDEPACRLEARLEVDGRVETIVAAESFLGRLVRGAAVDTYRADVALVRLAGALDAPTLPLARSWPAAGERLELFGYGCLSRCEPSAPPTLQRVSAVYGEPTSVVCAGDSGGPVIDARGRVVRITSGFRTKTGDDFFGDVVSLASALDATLARWQRPPTARPARACEAAADCSDCAAQRDCGYCAASSRCVEGTVYGPLDDDSCPVDRWIWSTRSCEAPEPLPSVTRVPAGDCATADDCATCARLPSCGWSEPERRCVRGTASGPREGGVEALGWVFMASCCPSAEVARCGDGSCGPTETCASCPADCGDCPPRCGDGVCDDHEDCERCAEDCVQGCGACAPRCGDGFCDLSESCASCADDCGACLDACGDGACNADETCGTCPSDCGPCPSACGDRICDAAEDCATCPEDCGSCGRCGDGDCVLRDVESCDVCPVDCGACPAGAPLVHIEWEEEEDVVRFSLLVPEGATRAELDIDGLTIGAPTRRLGAPPVLTVTTRLFTRREGRVLRARAFDAGGTQVATGDAVMDTTTGAGVWMRRRADRTFDIGLERASPEVVAIEIDADEFPLRDTIDGEVRSARGWLRATFNRAGTRVIALRTYGREGVMRGVLRRTLLVE